jgi:FkbM family methyltransferase
MKLIRQWLAGTLGTQNYLQLISQTYIRMVNAGFYKSKYPELFYLDHLIGKDFVCIDLGANVGYYSTRMSRLTKGTIYAVEPVALFREVLQQNLRTFKCDNVEIYPYALGSEEKKISMGTPVVDGVFRHGLTKVMDGSEQNMGQTYEVDMKVPDVLFSDLQRLDYVKCDVEGYETFIFPHFTKTLSKFKPVIQIEISSEDNRKQIADVLLPMGYRVFGLENGELFPLSATQMLSYNGGDFYFKA